MDYIVYKKMNNMFKGSLGKNSNASVRQPAVKPLSDIAPPSYATRPPKGHQKAASDIDLEEDDKIGRPNQAGSGRTQQIYDIDSDDDEAPVQSSHAPQGTASYRGWDKADHGREDENDRRRVRHDSARRDMSQALVRREPSPSYGEPEPSRGYSGGNKSKKSLTSGDEGGRQAANKKETITMNRFTVIPWDELSFRTISIATELFEISITRLKRYVDDGKVRLDRKTNMANFELMYPFFAPYIVERVKDELEFTEKGFKLNPRQRYRPVETEVLDPMNPAAMPYHPDDWYNPYEMSENKDAHDPYDPYCECLDCLL